MSAVRATKVNRAMMSLLTPAWREIADGTRDVQLLTDDEVFKGQLLGPTGKFGQRPSFYPQNFIDEQIRRSLNWANDEIRVGFRDAIRVLKEVMNNPTSADSDRLKAAMFFTDRFLGKEVSKVLITAEDPVESLFRSILSDPLSLVPHELSAEERAMLQ